MKLFRWYLWHPTHACVCVCVCAQPATVVWSSVGIRTHCMHVLFFFLHVWPPIFVCLVGDYQQNIFNRRSGGGLLRVRCWLGVQMLLLLVVCIETGRRRLGIGKGVRKGAPPPLSRQIGVPRNERNEQEFGGEVQHRVFQKKRRFNFRTAFPIHKVGIVNVGFPCFLWPRKVTFLLIVQIQNSRHPVQGSKSRRGKEKPNL